MEVLFNKKRQSVDGTGLGEDKNHKFGLGYRASTLT